jgi:pilus assembly protein CpaB
VDLRRFGVGHAFQKGPSIVSSRRTLILVAAIVIGALASFLVYGYVSGVQDKAYDDAQRLEVYVVKQTIPKGTYGEEATAAKLIVKDQIPKKFYPPNAIKDPNVDLGGKVAVNDLAVNQVITTDMFADPASVSSSFSDRLEKINDEDQVAISVSVDTVRGVAGLLQPGDYVNVMLSPTNAGVGSVSTDNGAETTEGEGAAQSDANSGFGARYLFQKVQILAIDKTPVAQAGEVSSTAEADAAAAAPGNSGLLTLIMPARAAQYMASADPSQIYLTLVSRDYEPKTQSAIDKNAPLPGEDPSVLTPYGPDGAGSDR